MTDSYIAEVSLSGWFIQLIKTSNCRNHERQKIGVFLGFYDTTNVTLRKICTEDKFDNFPVLIYNSASEIWKKTCMERKQILLLNV